MDNSLQVRLSKINVTTFGHHFLEIFRSSYAPKSLYACLLFFLTYNFFCQFWSLWLNLFLLPGVHIAHY